VDGSDPPVTVDHKRGRQRFEAAVQIARGVVAQHHTIVNLLHGDEGINRFPPVVVHRDSQNLETAVFILALEVHKPGDFDSARAAPGGPEIEEHDLALIVGQMDQLAVRVLQSEIGRVFTLIIVLDDRPLGLRRGACDQSENRGHARDGG